MAQRSIWGRVELWLTQSLFLPLSEAAAPLSPGRALGNPTYFSCHRRAGHSHHSHHITPMVTVVILQHHCVSLEWASAIILLFKQNLKYGYIDYFFSFSNFLLFFTPVFPLKSTLPFLGFLFLWKSYFEC